MKIIKKCEICGKSNFIYLFKQKDKNLDISEEFSINACKNCGVLIVNPQPSYKELEKYYSSDKYYSLKKIYPRENRKTQLKIFLYNLYFNSNNKNSILKTILSPIKFIVRGTKIIKNIKLLDVGSGSGQFLYEMKQLGMDVYGIEPGDFDKKEVEKYKLDIKKKDLIQYKSKNEYFDIITINHVLEHVDNPVKIIKKSNQLLKKNGLLLIGIPNKNSLAYRIFNKNWHQLDVPRHLFNYSNKNIRLLIENNGFRIKRIRYNSRPSQFVVSLFFALGIKKG